MKKIWKFYYKIWAKWIDFRYGSYNPYRNIAEKYKRSR
jgi:hypothetical protein